MLQPLMGKRNAIHILLAGLILAAAGHSTLRADGGPCVMANETAAATRVDEPRGIPDHQVPANSSPGTPNSGDGPGVGYPAETSRGIEAAAVRPVSAVIGAGDQVGRIGAGLGPLSGGFGVRVLPQTYIRLQPAPGLMAVASDQDNSRRIPPVSPPRSARPPLSGNYNSVSKGKRSVPMIVAGLVMAGAGAAMMATHADKRVTDPHALVENSHGTIPCTAYTYTIGAGSGSSSTDTTCSYTALSEHSAVFKTGAVMIPLGGLLSLLGLVHR